MRSFKIVLLGLLADLGSKAMVCRYLPREEKKPLWSDKIYLWHRKNKGISYGFFQQRFSEILILSGGMIAGCFLWLWRLGPQKERSMEKTGLSLLIGGALGNWLERFRYKRVTDFIYIKGKHAPVFNIGDCLIWIGSVMMVLASLKTKKNQ